MTEQSNDHIPAAEDVEGHRYHRVDGSDDTSEGMDPRMKRPSVDGDDVEGHRIKAIDDDGDDVEGHRIKAIDDNEDDVEGHHYKH